MPNERAGDNERLQPANVVVLRIEFQIVGNDAIVTVSHADTSVNVEYRLSWGCWD